MVEGSSPFALAHAGSRHGSPAWFVSWPCGPGIMLKRRRQAHSYPPQRMQAGMSRNRMLVALLIQLAGVAPGRAAQPESGGGWERSFRAVNRIAKPMSTIASA